MIEGEDQSPQTVATGERRPVVNRALRARAASSRRRPPVTALRSAPPPSGPSPAETTFNRDHNPDGGGSSGRRLTPNHSLLGACSKTSILIGMVARDL